MKTVIFNGYAAEQEIFIAGLKFNRGEPREVSDEVAARLLVRPYFVDATPAAPQAPAAQKKPGRKKVLGKASHEPGPD